MHAEQDSQDRPIIWQCYPDAFEGNAARRYGRGLSAKALWGRSKDFLYSGIVSNSRKHILGEWEGLEMEVNRLPHRSNTPFRFGYNVGE